MTTKAEALAYIHRIMCTEPWGGYSQGDGRLALTPTKPYDVYGVTVQIPAHDGDCSSTSAIAAKLAYGYKTVPYTYTGNEYEGLTSHGWVAHKVDRHKCWDGYVPKAGDIVLRTSGHTAVFQDAGKTISEFSQSEHHSRFGSAGDQTGWESKITDYSTTGKWDWIFEAPAGEWGTSKKEDVMTEADMDRVATKVIDKIKGITDDPTGRGYNLNIFDHTKWIAAAVAELGKKLDTLIETQAKTNEKLDALMTTLA